MSEQPSRMSAQAPAILPTVGISASTSRSVATYKLGGRSYPMQTSRRCTVCNTSYRMEIERSLLRSYSYSSIHRSLPKDAQDSISVTAISSHARNHMPVDAAVRQAAVESRAREMGTDLDTATGSLADHITFARVGLQRVYERMADGEIEPTIKDGIAFAQFLSNVEEQGGSGIDEEVIARGFMSYMRALRRVASPSQIREMGSIIQQDEAMRSLLAISERVEDESLMEEPEGDIIEIISE